LMSEMGAGLRAELSRAGGAESMIFRRLDGKANEPSTIPPIDAMSWRRVTSIVKSYLP